MILKRAFDLINTAFCKGSQCHSTRSQELIAVAFPINGIVQSWTLSVLHCQSLRISNKMSLARF